MLRIYLFSFQIFFKAITNYRIVWRSNIYLPYAFYDYSCDVLAGSKEPMPNNVLGGD